MRCFAFLTALLALAVASFSQAAPPSSASATSNSTSPTSMPELEHFSLDQVDKSLDPCNDFFQYACGKWIKANPIPPDQAGWGTFNKLAIWNVAAIHNTLEQAATPGSKRAAADQKAGDHYASCMDEAAINKDGNAPLMPR